MPIRIERVKGRCTSCGGENQTKETVMNISAGYRIGQSRTMHGISLCDVCLIFLKNGLHKAPKKRGVVKEHGPEPYVCLENHDRSED